MKPNDKTAENRQGANEVEWPPDPMGKWESPPVALVTPSRHIREQRAAARSRSASNGLMDRFLIWLRRHVD